MLAPGVAGASSIAVTNCNDSGAGSLRQAVTGSSSGSTVTFSLASACSLIHETSGSILISNNLTIDGPGSAALAVSGNNANSVFMISDLATVTISGLTIEDGNSDNGGGIDNDGILTISGCTISGNSANNNLGFGGGIFNDGTLVVSDTTISDNTEANFGGGIESDDGVSMTVTDSTISGNQAENGGGGIESTGGTALAVTNSTISGNSITGTGDGAGISTNGGSPTVTNSTIANNNAVNGAGIYNQGGALTVSNSTIANNTDTTFGAGGIDNDPGTTSIGGTILSVDDGNCSIPSSDFIDNGYNISDDASCDFSNVGSINNSSLVGRNLGLLGNNGGPTRQWLC